MSLWLLLGAKAGDNKQIVALAEATGLPFTVKQLQFTRASALPNIVLGPTLVSTTPGARQLLRSPWPTAVIASGRRSVAAARWIVKQSGGATRLIHIGRTWGPLDWFDLVITTPQYGLPERAHVVSNLMPMIRPNSASQDNAHEVWRQRFAELPRPWIAVLVGGNSRPYVLDEAAAVRLGQEANAAARESHGSLLVISAPRTGAAAFDALRRTIDAPAQVYAWGKGENPYAAALALADRIIVTGDSAAMVADAASAGKPVAVFELPTHRSLRWAFGSAFRDATERHAWLRPVFDKLVDLGLLTSVRDLGAYHRQLRAAGLLDGGSAAAERQKYELDRAAERVKRVLEL